MDPMPAVEPPPALPVAPVPPAAAFSAGAVLSTTGRVWRRNAVPFGLTALVILSPSLALTLAGWPGPHPTPASSTLVMLLLRSLGVISEGALAIGTLAALRGETPRVGAMLGGSLRRAWPLTVIAVVLGIGFGCGLLLLIAPGLIVIAGAYAAVPACVAEGGTFRQAIVRSWALTRGHRWPILAVALLLTIATGGLSYALSSGLTRLLSGPAWPPGLGPALGMALGIAIGTVAHTAPAVAYRDLRLEKDGAVPAALAAVFE